MTTVPTLPAASPVVGLHSPRLHGVALLLAPVLLLASTGAFLLSSGRVNDGVLGGTISVWSSFAFVLGFVGVARAFEARAPRLSVAVLVLSVLGFMTGLSYSISAIDLGLTGAAFMGADPEPTGLDAIGFFAFDPWGLALPLAYLLTALTIWRTRSFPRWTAIALLVGGVLFVPSREVELPALALAADTVLLIGLIPIAIALLRARSTARPARDAG